MDIRIIKSPSQGTVDILLRRKGSNQTVVPECMDAIGLAEKAVGVTVEDIKGSCPQNMVLLALFGDTASVESALHQIRSAMEGGAYTPC